MFCGFGFNSSEAMMYKLWQSLIVEVFFYTLGILTSLQHSSFKQACCMIDKQWIVGETCPLKRLLNATPFARVFIKYNMYSLCSGHIKAFLQCTLSLYLNDVSKKHVRGRRFPKSFLAVVLVPSWFSISLLRCWSGNRV